LLLPTIPELLYIAQADAKSESLGKFAL